MRVCMCVYLGIHSMYLSHPIYVYLHIPHRAIGLRSRVFANGPGDESKVESYQRLKNGT